MDDVWVDQYSYDFQTDSATSLCLNHRFRRQVTVECDVSRRSDRQLTADVAAFTSFRAAFTSFRAFFNRQLLLAETQAGALSYNVSLRISSDKIRIRIR